LRFYVNWTHKQKPSSPVVIPMTRLCLISFLSVFVLRFPNLTISKSLAAFLKESCLRLRSKAGNAIVSHKAHCSHCPLNPISPLNPPKGDLRASKATFYKTIGSSSQLHHEILKSTIGGFKGLENLGTMVAGSPIESHFEILMKALW